MKYIATVDDREFTVEINEEGQVTIDGVPYEIDFESVSDQPVYSLLINGRSFEGLVLSEDDLWQVLLKGTLYKINVEDERERRLRAAGGGQLTEQTAFHLKAPMPGLVVDVPVTEGQQVEQGDVLVILESMKMQNELKSPRAGTVTRVRIQPGDSVDQRETMVSVE